MPDAAPQEARSPAPTGPVDHRHEAAPSWPWLASAGLIGAGLLVGASGDRHTPRAAQDTATLDGQVMLGPAVPGNDLRVDVLAADGRTLLGSEAVDDQGRFHLAITGGGIGSSVVLRLHSTGSHPDIASESQLIALDLPADLHTVTVLTAGTTPVHVTPLTDVLARTLLKDDGSIGAIAPADVHARSRATALALGLGDGLTALERIGATPTVAVDAQGRIVDVAGADLHGQLLKRMDLAASGAGSFEQVQLAYAQDLRFTTVWGDDGQPTMEVTVLDALAAALAAARLAMANASPGLIG